MNDEDTPNKEEYSKALKEIDDLEPYIELASRLFVLAQEGRINDMRRLLVVESVKSRENHLKEDLKVVDEEEYGSITWESPGVAELRIQLINALAGTAFGFHSSQLEAIWPLIESRFNETSLSDKELERLVSEYADRWYLSEDGDSDVLKASSKGEMKRQTMSIIKSRDQQIALEAQKEAYELLRWKYKELNNQSVDLKFLDAFNILMDEIEGEAKQKKEL